ncbi:hypothetical protein OH77DRAFT_238840 [Trametes cingulata]|nr:hypothetical protein OH77DRAFT_238840 [Trametes cingulata]
MPTASRTRAPLLPVAISQSPLLSGALPDELFSNLAKPLPTITVGLYDASSPRLGVHRPQADENVRWPTLPSPSSSSSSPTTPAAPISPKEVIALLNLLESMENDVATEVQRVRLGIQEARMLVHECREDCRARASEKRERRDRERRETKGPDDDFWLASEDLLVLSTVPMEARGFMRYMGDLAVLPREHEETRCKVEMRGIYVERNYLSPQPQLPSQFPLTSCVSGS